MTAEKESGTPLERLEAIAPFLREVAQRPEAEPIAHFLNTIANKVAEVHHACDREAKEAERDYEDLEVRSDDAESEAAYQRERWGCVEELIENLHDIENGIRDFDEVFAKWKDGIPIG